MIIFLALLLPMFAIASVEQQVELQSRVFVDSESPYADDAALSYQVKNHKYLDNDDLLQLNLEMQKSFKNDGRYFANIQELYWSRIRDEWEVKIGIDTVFWGKAESVNVVDIINQKNVLSTDGKAKLGSLMAHFTKYTEDGLIDFFYLPKHNKRKYSSGGGGLNIVSNKYDNGNKQSLAVRLQQAVNNVDFAVSYFNGVSNSPVLIPVDQGYQAYYADVRQLGFDAQITTNEALYKFEHLTDTDNKYSSVGGIEYIAGDSWTVNLLLEHMRSNKPVNAYQNDTMVGLRVDFSDELGTEGLLSVIYDHDYGSKILTFKGSRRIDNNNKLTLEANFFDINLNDSALISQDKNDSISLKLTHYF